MTNTTTIQHPKEVVLFTVSRFFERAAFYGIRSLLIIYMLQSSLAMSEEKVHQLYGWFVSSFIFSSIIGALFGDLIMGSKWASIVGGALQALGAFVLCVPNELALYLGLLLIVIGNGFYSPNIVSSVGKLYKGREGLLDSAYTLLYLVVNIGAFLGAYFITVIAQESYYVGFIVCGVLMILSLIPIILYKQPLKEKEEIDFNVYSDKNILIVVGSILLASFFWIVYDVSSEAMFQLQMNMEKGATIGMSTLMNSIGPMIVVFFGIVFSIIWSFIHFSTTVKLLIGFILAALSSAILLFTESMDGMPLVVMYIISILLISLAELLIAPILTALTIKKSNSKYFALIFSAASLPYGLYLLIKRIFSISFDLSFNASVFIGIICFGIISLILLLIALLKKEQKN